MLNTVSEPSVDYKRCIKHTVKRNANEEPMWRAFVLSTVGIYIYPLTVQDGHAQEKPPGSGVVTQGAHQRQHRPWHQGK